MILLLNQRRQFYLQNPNKRPSSKEYLQRNIQRTELIPATDFQKFKFRSNLELFAAHTDLIYFLNDYFQHEEYRYQQKIDKLMSLTNKNNTTQAKFPSVKYVPYKYFNASGGPFSGTGIV